MGTRLLIGDRVLGIYVLRLRVLHFIFGLTATTHCGDRSGNKDNWSSS